MMAIFSIGIPRASLYSDFGLTYRGLVDWLDASINYRHVFEKTNSKWKKENRPHLNTTVKWECFDFDLSNRARLEYGNREDAENFWRYRNKFTVKLPFKLTK